MTLALTPLAIALVLTTATSAASATSRTAKRLIKKTPHALCLQSEKQQAWRDRVGDLGRCAMGRPAHPAILQCPVLGRGHLSTTSHRRSGAEAPSLLGDGAARMGESPLPECLTACSDGRRCVHSAHEPR